MNRKLARILLREDRNSHKKKEQKSLQENASHLADIKGFQPGIGEEGTIIFDVGANVGNTVAGFAADFPAATIFAFEPASESFEQLKRLASEKIHPVQCALSDRVGEAAFHLHSRSGWHSLLSLSEEVSQWRSGKSELEHLATVSVPIDTIDHFCSERAINKIDVLKIDVQGSELNVLKGAETMLKSGRINWIYAEMLFVDLYEQQCHFHDIYNFLWERDYRLLRFYGDKYSSRGRLKWLNGLFARPGLLEQRED
jgi:FkbM family methyltransferase